MVDNPDMLTNTLFEAVHRTGRRALISKGWSNLGCGQSEIPDYIFLLGSCPHDWLFRHVSCVVHHGGAGTTAAGLLLGRPTVIVPFFGDQPFWGSIVARAGAGPLPIPFKELTAERLAAAIQTGLGEQTQQFAREIGENMRSEQGVQNAVQSFHRHLDVDKLRCSICPDRPAVWWLRHSHIKLSTFAASILVHTGHINPHNVLLYEALKQSFLASKSDGLRYRAQEYDTNRDPRGPLSAGAEVMYGLMTDLVVSFAHVPGQIIGVFPGSRPRNAPKDYAGREWAMSHFAECLSDQQKREDTQTGTSTNGSGQSPGDTCGILREASAREQRASITTDQAPAKHNKSHVVDGPDYIHGNPAMENGHAELSDKKYSRAKRDLSEARYHAVKCAKYALNFMLVLPTDLTLSLSKGFHNAPKLYHDDTVKPIPKAMGIKSGFRAAGKVSQDAWNLFQESSISPQVRKCTRACTMECQGLSLNPHWASRNMEAKGC